MHTEGPAMLCNSISVCVAFKMFWVSWGLGKDNEREEGMQVRVKISESFKDLMVSNQTFLFFFNKSGMWNDAS